MLRDFPTQTFVSGYKLLFLLFWIIKKVIFDDLTSTAQDLFVELFWHSGGRDKITSRSASPRSNLVLSRWERNRKANPPFIRIRIKVDKARLEYAFNLS